MKIPDIPPITGVPDDFTRVLNQRLRRIGEQMDDTDRAVEAAAGATLTGGPPPQPHFNVSVSELDPTVAQIYGVTFSGNPDDVQYGVFTLSYVDESTPVTLLNGAINDSIENMTVDDATHITAGMLVEIDGEVILCGEPSGDVVPITRGQLGSTAASHVDDAPLLAVAKRIEAITWPIGFWLTTKAADWMLDVALPERKLVAVAAFVKNNIGSSATTTECLTDNANHGLRLTSTTVIDGVTMISVVNADLALSTGAQVVSVLATTRDCTITLPPADSSQEGLSVTVKRVPSSTYNVIVEPAGSNTIEGSAGSVTMSEAGEARTWVAEIGNWVQTASAGNVTSGAVYPPLLPAGVSATENAGERWVDPNTRVPMDVIDVTVTRQTDDRAEWFDVWLYDPAIGWGGSEGRWKVGETVRISRPAPATTTAGYKVRVTTGSSLGENDPSDAVESGAFSLTGIQRPAAGGVTIVTPGTFSPRIRSDGSQYAYISPFTWQDPSTDIWAFFVRVTVQVGRYISGVWTPAPGRAAAVDEGGDEVPHAGTQVTGGSHATDGLALDFNSPGSVNNVVKFRFYLHNRLSTSEWDFTDTNKTRYQLDYDVSIAPITVSSVAMGETGSRSINSSQETFSTLRTTVAVSANPATMSLTLWHSYDNGTTWDWIGWFDKTGTSGITLDVVHAVPLAAGTWKAAVAPRQVGRTATLPADAVVSPGYSMAGLGAPSATAVGSLAVVGPTYAGINSIGAPYWTMSLSGSPPATLDPNTWTFLVTVEGCDESGSPDPGPSPNAGEREWFEFVNGPDVVDKSLAGNYNAAGSAHTALKIRVYAINRASTVVPGWKDPGAVLVQWPDAALYKIVSFGPRPERTLDLTAARPETLGVLGDGQELLVDCGFEFSEVGTVDGTPGKRRWYPNAGGMAIAAGAGLPAGGAQYASVPYVQYAGALQFCPVAAGKRYRMSCWARSDGTATQSMKLYVDFYDAANNNLGVYAASADIAPTTSWTQCVVITPAAPSQAAWARTIFAWQPASSGSGAWWVDGCSFREVQEVGQGLQIDGAGLPIIGTGSLLEGFFASQSVSGRVLADAAAATAKIQDLAVARSKLAGLSVDATKMADLAVEAAKLANSAVTAQKIANAAVGAAAIAALAVGTASIQDAAVTNAKISALAVSAANIQDASITDAKIQNLSVSKLLAGAIQVSSQTSGLSVQWTGGSSQTDVWGGGVFTSYGGANMASMLATSVGGYISVGLGATEVVGLDGYYGLLGRQLGLRVYGLRVVGPRQPAIYPPYGGAVQDAEARLCLVSLISMLNTHGLIG